MLTGQTTIKRVVARCPARTEPLLARMRLSHLLRGADLAPPGLPPQAVLVVRRVAARHNVSLNAFRVRPEWEREAREEVARNWRRAVRPTRGHVPADAEAVLFADVSEWLASLGLAVARREVERHWCWAASLGAGLTTSTPDTLVRTWAEAPRFVPAAIVRLAHWGEAARVLRLLRPPDARALLSGIAAEYDLPRSADALHFTRAAAPETPSAASHFRAPTNDTPASIASFDDARHDDHHPTTDSHDLLAHAGPPPWKRWMPSTESACERLHAPAQRLLAFAAALFHAPAHARTRAFAAEVTAYFERHEAPRPESATPPTATRRAPHAHRLDDATREHDDGAHDSAETFAATDKAATTTRFEHDTLSRAIAVGRHDEESATPTSSARRSSGDARDEESKDSGPLINARAEGEEVAEELAARAAWRDLEGGETALGGVLFLLNFFIHLRLPECFDEDFRLSEHVTGWGLAELVARALLAEADCGGAYDRDPLWAVLARLDGRREGEPPAASLRVGEDYRAPAHWLKHFAADDARAWSFHVSGPRLLLLHAGGFPAAVRTLAGAAPARVAAEIVADFRARGVAFAGVDVAFAGVVDERAADENATTRASDVIAEVDRASVFASFGRVPLSAGLRRWMGWTLPFMKYVLARALADGGEALTREELARTLLFKRGRLHATATHVDLVMELNQVSFEVRRAGFDASPGWVRDLVRVVAFHYE